MSGGDFDFEPVRGLPARLPPGETLLWQGAPDLRATALRVFHVRKVALYFVALAAWRAAIVWEGGATPWSTAYAASILLGLGLGAMAILMLIAVLVCRTTVYSITSRRVVMRIGVALPITFNIPYAVLASGAVTLHDRGVGSIPLTLKPGNKLSYLVLWPHVRPWRLARTEPMLRLVPDAAAVAQMLAQAVVARSPETMQAVVAAGQPAAAPAGWPMAPAAA